MQNPYTNRSTIHDPAMFFGRSADLTRIYALLANTQSISIVGDRRIGKSSLLYCLSLPQVQARVERHDFSNYIFVHADLQGSAHRSPVEFLHYLLGRLRSQIKADWQVSLDQAAAGQDAFENAVAEINRRDCKLVLLLDEFDYVTRNEQLDAAFFSFMRYMATNYELAIVTASQQRLVDLCHSDIVDSPFFNIFARVALGALDQEAALALISKPSLTAGYPLAEDAPWVLALTGRQPMFIQIACFYLLEAKARLPAGETVDYEAVKQLFGAEAEDHFEYAWTHLSQQAQAGLQKEGRQEQGPYAHYLSAGSAFRLFVRQRGGGPVTQEALITSEAIEATLKNFWKVADLGQCPLVELNLVKQYLAQQELPPIGPNLGRALQDVLRTAIAHLRPLKEDKTSKQWLHWSILQQSYVEGLLNKDITRRLNIAERTFYRERVEATRALIQILQEMELGTAMNK